MVHKKPHRFDTVVKRSNHEGCPPLISFSTSFACLYQQLCIGNIPNASSNHQSCHMGVRT
eukprot:XP_001708917.1 Hypothetical protein GL50803_35402 [Giardia lamblia ATCC 50803]